MMMVMVAGNPLVRPGQWPLLDEQRRLWATMHSDLVALPTCEAQEPVPGTTCDLRDHLLALTHDDA